MILVTGGTGLVGSYLLHSLLNKGEQVRAILYNKNSLDRTKKIFISLGSDPGLLNQVEWVEGNILDVTVVYDAMQGIDTVYHCAAIVSFNPVDKDHMLNVNVNGTINVVNAALANGVKKLCHVSSIAALGRSDNSDTIDESSEWRNSVYNSRYSRTKYMAEREVWRASAEGLPVIVINPAIILGYGHPEKGSTRMFRTIYKMSKFYGRGTNGFVDVRDVVDAMILLMESDISNERFVVSSGNYSYREIFGLIADGFKRPRPSIALPDVALDLFWRLEALRSQITKDKPLITRETVRTSKNRYLYSSNKLVKTLNFKYRPINETISMICSLMEPELSEM